MTRLGRNIPDVAPSDTVIYNVNEYDGTRMRAQVRCALGQQDRGAFGAANQGEQDGSRPQRRPLEQGAAIATQGRRPALQASQLRSQGVGLPVARAQGWQVGVDPDDGD